MLVEEGSTQWDFSRRRSSSPCSRWCGCSCMTCTWSQMWRGWWGAPPPAAGTWWSPWCSSSGRVSSDLRATKARRTCWVRRVSCRSWWRCSWQSRWEDYLQRYLRPTRLRAGQGCILYTLCHWCRSGWQKLCEGEGEGKGEGPSLKSLDSGESLKP